jgi:hypothetical protein
MFVELGEALMKRELWERALDCFASINEEDAVSVSYLDWRGELTIRLKMSHPTSTLWESVCTRLEKRSRRWITFDGVRIDIGR